MSTPKSSIVCLSSSATWDAVYDFILFVAVAMSYSKIDNCNSNCQ